MEERTLRIWLTVGSVVMVAALIADFTWVITTALGVR